MLHQLHGELLSALRKPPPTFALLDRAATRTVDDLRAGPWALSHHLVKVNCRVGVVQIVVREELRLVFVSKSLCTSLQVWITVTNQSFCTGNETVHTRISQCDIG
jgi:hypothetical protein